MKRNILTALVFAATLPTLAFAGTDCPMMGGGAGDGLGAGFGAGPAGFHQAGPDRGPMFADLELTREQKQQVRKLMAGEMKARHGITRRYLDKLPEADKAAMKKEMDDSRDKTQTAIRALLTPEQQKTFDEHQKEMDARRKEFDEFLKWKASQAAPKAQ